MGLEVSSVATTTIIYSLTIWLFMGELMVQDVHEFKKMPLSKIS